MRINYQFIFDMTVSRHRGLVTQFYENQFPVVKSIVQLLVKTIKRHGVIYLCGNGGSAADAQHIAGELIGRFKQDRRPFPAVALSTDTSVITAIGNDYGYDRVFSRQVGGLMTDRDVLWALSTSGESKNVVQAAIIAKMLGAKVISFTGSKYNSLKNKSNLHLFVESPVPSQVQEIHQLAYHLICDMVERRLA